MMTRKNKFIAFTLILFMATSMFAFSYKDRLFEIQKNIDIFTTLYREVNKFYVDDVNPNTIMRTGIDAMLNSLDPYTNYIAEDQIENYRTMTTGQYGGIGALVGNRNGKTIIIMPYEDFPANKSGIKVGDEVLKIDGIPLAGKDSDEVSKLLKGQAGSKVRLEIKSYGDEGSREISLNRENIKIPNVPYQGMVSSEVGYFKLSEFTNNASQDVKSAVENLKKQGAKKLIIDLRGNPGGLLNESINICNLFIPRDLEVVSTKGRIEEWNRTYRSLNEPLDTEIPLIILINNRSASASEIVSGVMQDYDRGVLVGQRSFGKGLVQTTRPLSYNSQLKVTIAKYYTPSGRCIQALDYTHRKEDGTVDKFADSLRTAFKTKNGRTVYDGTGVNPDIDVSELKYAPIANALNSKNYIFEYANVYALKHSSIKLAKDFKLTEAEYQAFLTWLKGKDYNYTTEVERSLEELEVKAKEEKYYDGIQNQIQSLKSKISSSKIQDLELHKEEIKALLEIEIVAHYYLESGQTEAFFKYDSDLKAALSLFNDMDRYHKILKGNK
jgi:carboxyl-terminal processing protease